MTHGGRPASQEDRSEVRMVGRGLLLVISAPSGAGKTTLCKELAANVPELWQSVSYTTRQPRPGEVDGREYRFVAEAVFRDMVERSAFAEWASVYGHLYGTPKGPLNEKMASGIDVLLEIDGQGATQIKKHYPDAVSIYILPPSMEVLRARLTQRGSDAPEEIQRRLDKAREEVWSYRNYSYIVRNVELKQAYKDLESIILAERMKTTRVDTGWLEEHFFR